jgi:hypothetical protein
MIEDYISPCGGLKLTKDDVAVINGHTTTRNENSQLFLAYTQRALPKFQFYKCFIRLMEATRIGRGRYSRRPGDAGLIRQSHDNLIGIAWLSWKYNHLEYLKEINSFARWRMWNYCLTKLWDYRCQLQGSTVFVLKLAAGEKPGYLTTIWWALSLVVSDHSSDGYLRKMLQIDIVEGQWKLLSKTKQRICAWAIDIHKKRRENLKRWYLEYFHEDTQHPARNGDFYE